MKPRANIELSIGRPIFNFLAALKLFFLTALLILLFLNVTFTLYTNVSARHYTYPHPPFLKITSSSTFSFSSSSSFSSYDPYYTSSSSSSSSNSTPSALIAPPPRLQLQKPSSSYSNTSLSSSPSPPLTIYNLNTRFDRSRGCDLSKGEWIRDPSGPYYTNSTCWTIQEHQNCMKYGRPNLDFLKWRWKPDRCELPHLEPKEFLEFMRGRSMAFIGDSLARNQMQSLMCLLSRVENPEETWPPAENVTKMFYRNYNFTIWAYWSPFLISAEETLTGNKYKIWSLYLDEPDPFWQLELARFDHIVLNTGNWFNRPAHFYVNRKLIGCHYCLVKNTPYMSVYKAHRRAFRTALDAVVGNRQGFKGVAIVRTVSPSHFEGGEWNKGGDCRRTAPLRRGGGAKLAGMDLELYRDQLKEFWKAKWEGSEKGVEFRLLDTTRAMLLRPDGHPSRYGHWPNEPRDLYNDCVHWCLPGPVDMWNDLLFQVMRI